MDRTLARRVLESKCLVNWPKKIRHNFRLRVYEDLDFCLPCVHVPLRLHRRIPRRGAFAVFAAVVAPCETSAIFRTEIPTQDKTILVSSCL